MTHTCLFCKIVRKEIPSSVVHEDESVLAFSDINPQAPVHILVIPKEHIERVSDLSSEHAGLLIHMLTAANKLAREKNIADRGYRLVLNCNAEAGQSVFHVHMHLLGGRIMRWPPG